MKISPLLITNNFVINQGQFFFVINHKHTSDIDNGAFWHCRLEEISFPTVLAGPMSSIDVHVSTEQHS